MGVKYKELLSVLNFMYIDSEELYSFLTVAKDLE
jgi:hypothetical protein